MKTYTVVGLYEDNLQRYADTFKARDPDQAEQLAVLQAQKDEGTNLLVAAVLEGDVKVLR